MKSASEVLDAINALEHSFPVQLWHAKDIDLWPVYRVRLFMDVTLGILDSEPRTGQARRIAQLAERATRALCRVPIASWRDRRMNAALQTDTAAVFFSDGLSFTCIGGKWWDRVIDPLQLAMHDRGLRALKLTPLAEAHIPRLVPSRFVQPAIDRIKLIARGSELQPELAQFDDFLTAARVRFGTHPQSREWLALQASRLDRLAQWFCCTLERCGARHALVNNYYSLEGMAFVQAARRLSVPSADLQHGLQGRHHAAYGRWDGVPAVAGYSTLPDEFWVWSDKEASAINAWRANRPIHQPRVTGNLWRERWLDDTDPLVAQYIEQARALRRNHATPQALVSLAWGLADEETDKLIRAASLCGSRVAWWWRLHPVEAHRRDEFAAKLARHGLDASQVGAATDLPLYALVRAADLILAHSSTVIQEAAVFGVPSVVTSDYGAEIHSDLLREEMAVRATSAESIARAVQDLALRERRALPGGAERKGGVERLIESVFVPRPARTQSQETAQI